VAPRKRDAAFSANEREPQTSALLVQNDGGFFMSISIRESFSAEQTEHALGPDPFSPKRLRLLQALADAIFSEAPADPAARQENNELVASFAELFFPALPEEQARSQLTLLVTTLLNEAAEEEKRRNLARRDASTSEFDDCAATANSSDNSELQQAAEAVVRQAMQEHRSRPKDQALLNLLSRSTSTAQGAASTNGAEPNKGELRSFSPIEELYISQGMRNSGKSRAYIIDELLDFGIL
jgi:hypothetical protein